jgi:hypothetical protein
MLRYFLLAVYDMSGPGGIRTLGHLVKSQMLYLAELQALLRPGLNLIIIFLYNTL